MHDASLRQKKPKILYNKKNTAFPSQPIIVLNFNVQKCYRFVYRNIDTDLFEPATSDTAQMSHNPVTTGTDYKR